jgi:hypothetical protein
MMKKLSGKAMVAKGGLKALKSNGKHGRNSFSTLDFPAPTSAVQAQHSLQQWLMNSLH